MVIEPWEVDMLGGLRARRRDRLIERFRTRQVAGLLAYLAYHAGKPASRDELAEMFWPVADPERQRQYLRQALYFLRRHLDTGARNTIIIADHAGIRLQAESVQTDVDRFRGFCSDLAGAGYDAEKLDRLSRAVDLYRGPLLPQMDELWIEPERHRLRDAYLGALRRLMRARAESRDYDSAIDYAHLAVREDPYREESHRALMRLYVAVGRPAAARAQYDDLYAILAALGSAPSAETEALVSRLPDSAPVPQSSRPKEPLNAPPENGLTGGRPNLPTTLTRLFGRSEETADLHRIVVAEGVRLVTLTGPGGVGKTRLSVEAAHSLSGRFSERVYYVPLADLRDPETIPDAVLAALPTSRDSKQTALDQAISFLSHNPSLLLLDNYEQLIPKGKATALALLKRCPELQILATSRRKLGIAGEREFRVSFLSIPPPGKAAPVDPESISSIALFVDRAQASRAEFHLTRQNASTVAAICRRLEGLPLAIELAAARISTLTLAQILTGVEGRSRILSTIHGNKSNRHCSLWATIEWSHGLLPADLQDFFARLSVFRGGWTAEAASRVALANHDERDDDFAGVFDKLDRLRSHALLEDEERNGELRFRMLETVREFAAEKLSIMPSASSTRELHLEYFLSLAEESEEHLTAPSQQTWLELLEGEHDNLRAALAWSLDGSEQRRHGLRLAGALSRFWMVRGYLAEGRKWLSTALAKSRSEQAPTARAKGLNGAATLSMYQGDYVGARDMLEEALGIARGLGDLKAAAPILNNLATIDYDQRNYEGAQSLYEQTLATWRTLGDRRGVAACLNNLGNVAYDRGDYSLAQEMQEQALLGFEEMGHRRGIAISLCNLGDASLALGEPATAKKQYTASLAIYRETGDSRGCAFALEGLAAVAAALQEPLEAACLWGAAETLRIEAGAPLSPGDSRRYEEQVSAARAALANDAAFDSEWMNGKTAPIDQTIAFVQQENSEN